MKTHIMQQIIPGMAPEILYAFVLIFCSLLIYLGTKELYELSSHKGIKYFRNSFLFFALAYFFRSIVKLLFLFMDPRQIMNSSFIYLVGPITFLLFMYFSSMAVFYLVYSVLWKKIDKTIGINFFPIIAGIIALVSLLSREFLPNLILNLVLFLLVVLAFYLSHIGSKKKKNNLLIIYLLLAGFWFLNILDTLIPEFLQLFQIVVYLFSISIFLIILYKVMKIAGGD